METYQSVLTTVSVVLAVKLLLIPSYTSTDFEVHRNWMAITSNLKLSRWYYDVTSEWTLDYPPFFAYFELILSKIADKIGLGDILTLQKEPLMNERVLYFQRISVIVCDMFYMGAAAFLCFKSSKIWFSQPRRVVPRAQLALFVLLTTNAGLILVDNVHFQYNGLLTALLLLSLFFVENGSLLKAALVYSTLLNFKHIYVYYAPAFVIFYLHQYFDDYRNIAGFLSKGLSLFFALLTPIIVSFGPFIAAGGIEGAQQILSRLFPVSRGLTHAYWAPNFWAFYNFADMVLNRVTMIILKQKTKLASGYSSGLVQEHSHALLPSITTLISLACVVSSLAPLCLLFLKKKRQPFSLYLTLSALSFFYFGYHVHEKALLLVSIPLTVLSFHNPVFVSVSVLFSTITSFSLFPLLFTLFEVPIKYGLAVTYFFLMVFCYRYTFKTRISFILPTRTILFGTGLILVEVYATFIHKAIFAEKLAFFPLMLISVYNTIGVTGCYIWIVKLALEDEYLLVLKKKKCELTEEMIKASAYPVQSVDSLEEVKMVAGVDISTSKINSQFAVVSLTIFSFPELEHLTSHEEIVLITEPYITDYLALREAGPIADVVRRFFDQNSQYRPDVLICDGNGRFHSRGCGVACQIGAKAGVASVGVAKNLNLSLLKAVGATKDDLRKADELVDYVSRQKEDGFVPFDVIEPVTMNIARLGGSKVPVYVSAGYGLELDLATEIVIKCARNRICEPIRMADLRSREKVRELFD